MNKLAHIATALAKNTLSGRDMFHVKGGNNSNNDKDKDLLSNVLNIVEDEKRRERPGGGINTN